MSTGLRRADGASAERSGYAVIRSLVDATCFGLHALFWVESLLYMHAYYVHGICCILFWVRFRDVAVGTFAIYIRTSRN